MLLQLLVSRGFKTNYIKAGLFLGKPTLSHVGKDVNFVQSLYKALYTLLQSTEL